MRNKLGQFQKGNMPWSKGKRTYIERICKNCTITFYIIPALINKRKYCSHKCYWKSITGKHFVNNGQFQKGNMPWSKGKRIRVGGIIIKCDYITIYSPDHPSAKKSKYIKKSRLVMEKHLNRYLNSTEIVHHKGINFSVNSPENKQDDSLENLHLFSNVSAHTKYHAKLRKSKS